MQARYEAGAQPAAQRGVRRRPQGGNYYQLIIQSVQRLILKLCCVQNLMFSIIHEYFPLGVCSPGGSSEEGVEARGEEMVLHPHRGVRAALQEVDFHASTISPFSCCTLFFDLAYFCVCNKCVRISVDSCMACFSKIQGQFCLVWN